MATTDADPWDAVLAHLTRPADRRAGDATSPRHTTRRGREVRAPLHGEARNDPLTQGARHRRPPPLRRDVRRRRPIRLTPRVRRRRATRQRQLEDQRRAGGAGAPPHRDKPWVNLAGWWGADRFCAGGQVLGTNDAHSVRLTSRDGTSLEDDTKAGIVLFIADQSSTPRHARNA